MGLDRSSTELVLAHLRELAAGSIAVAVVDHDREALASVNTRTVVLKDGRARDLERA